MDLPGCIATAKTKNTVIKRMREAVEFHLDGLREEGERIPPSHSYSAYLSVAA
ncbi:MAG: type II toxin-antitoxin system HicB family antitoxin [Deltaproteobacteria bacterium]|nr:type II toxin-antitoxin system HicB family antitoxin [Deltaproteobacteria bacterium]